MTPLPHDRRALVAVDLGAESCRISLLRWIDSQPQIILVHRFPNAPRSGPTGLRWDLAAIEPGVHHGLRKAAALAPEGIRSLAVDGWAVDYIRLNPQGAAIADPFCYRDERTIAAEQSLHAILSAARMRQITGVQILRINTLYQQHADSHEDNRLPWLNLPEYILHRLGAPPVAEYTMATHTQMIDLATKTWSPEILAAAGLSASSCPQIVSPGTRLGHIQGPLAALPAFANTLLIAPAAHDTASAIAGIPAQGDDWAYISSGTWSLVGTLLDQPCNHPQACADNFTNLGAAAGCICFHKNVNGMWLIRQCIEHWSQLGSTWSFSDLIRAAESLPTPIALLQVDDPDLLLPGNMPQRINTQRLAHGLAPLNEEPANAPAFANLIFHSLAARYAQVLQQIQLHSGKCLKRLFIVGGGSRNSYLNRLTAVATGLEVIKGAQESSTLGNYAVQLASLERDSGTTLTPEHLASWAQVLTSASATALT